MELLNTIRTFIENLGIAQIVFGLIVLVIGTWGIFSGIFLVLIRLGRGLARRKIAIFAKGDRLQSLKALLLDSKLVKVKNIKEISSVDDIGRTESCTVFVVFWEDWKDDIEQILRTKNDSTALIVYAPVELGYIPQKRMSQIGELRNVMVTNFRGRLLNDIVVSMITTSYVKEGK